LIEARPLTVSCSALLGGARDPTCAIADVGSERARFQERDDLLNAKLKRPN
jgi:hypothetical protein